METFFPLPSAIDSASAMHSDDLIASLDAALMVVLTLHQDDGSLPLYDQHPVVQMWQGHVPFLLDQYAFVYMDELQNRYVQFGHSIGRPLHILEDMRQKFTRHADYCLEDSAANVARGDTRPVWVGSSIHAAHQAALLRRRMDFYSTRFPDTSPRIPLFYPSPGLAQPLS